MIKAIIILLSIIFCSALGIIIQNQHLLEGGFSIEEVRRYQKNAMKVCFITFLLIVAIFKLLVQ
jgi:hypothetical protein